MNAKAVSNRPRLSSEERKASIVSAACKLFADKGFRGVTTRELAAAVGVTEPVLYEHFRTKRELYSAIIEAKAQGGLEALSSINERYSGSGNDHAFFQALGFAILDWYRCDPTFIRLLLFSSLEGHELRELFYERSNDCFVIVHHYLERRIAEGVFREVDPALASRAFFGMVAHYALTALIFGFSPLPRAPEDVVREMVDIFLNGLRKQQGQTE